MIFFAVFVIYSVFSPLRFFWMVTVNINVAYGVICIGLCSLTTAGKKLGRILISDSNSNNMRSLKTQTLQSTTYFIQTNLKINKNRHMVTMFYFSNAIWAWFISNILKKFLLKEKSMLFDEPNQASKCTSLSMHFTPRLSLEASVNTSNRTLIFYNAKPGSRFTVPVSKFPVHLKLVALCNCMLSRSSLHVCKGYNVLWNVNYGSK